MKTEREKRATRVTLYGAAINIILVIFKLIAGVLGQSAAMIADGIHSLSDLLTDAVVIIFMKLSSRPQDEDHDYGHGKYETLATAIIGMALFVVGLGICYGGVVKIWTALQGGQLEQPGWIALVAALLSIALKEWCFQFTMRTGRAIESETVMANAWHHRSDALSSVGTAIGIGGAIALGPSWAVLDPIAAVIVSVLIVITAWKLMANALGELLEKSLPEAMERQPYRHRYARTLARQPDTGRSSQYCLQCRKTPARPIRKRHVYQHTHGTGERKEPHPQNTASPPYPSPRERGVKCWINSKGIARKAIINMMQSYK